MSVALAPSLGAASPELSPLPMGVPRRLIDDGTLHYEASTAGFAERYRRGETAHTIHVWWARRPYSAMRSLVFACLSKDTSQHAHELMDRLSISPPGSLVLSSARSSLSKEYPRPPRALDMFGGGGTIAFEGISLGADMHSIDSNELSVFVQKSILVYPQDVPWGELAHHLKKSGKRVLERLTILTADLYPLRSSTFAYFWTYSTNCERCNYRFYLSKRPWLSRKKGKRIAFVFSEGTNSQNISITEVAIEQKRETPWVGKNGTVRCPHCKNVSIKKQIQNCQDELIGVAQPSETKGKRFITSPPGAIPPLGKLIAREREMLSALQMKLPSSSLPKWSGIVNPSLYGIKTHADFVNLRQRIVLLTLIQCLDEEFELLATSASPGIARAVIGLLSGLVDQLVDWNCRLSMWIPQNEQVGRAFCGPGIAMLWDYAETDPVSAGPSNLWSKLNRIVAGASTISILPASCKVRQACAQELPFGDGFFDAIVTDPPYYDNIYYNALADFFFAWKRPLLKKIAPELSTNLQTDSSRELVASTFRSGDPIRAHSDYCRELGRAVAEAERVLTSDGVFALLYSHSSLQGWEALVRAYRPTRLTITSVQPLSIERKQRPRAMTSEAVNTCVVFVSHKGGESKPSAEIDSLCSRLKHMIEPFHNNLAAAGWHERDIAIAAYSQAVGLLANVSSVSGIENDREALKQFEAIVQQRFRDFRVTTRSSL